MVLAVSEWRCVMKCVGLYSSAEELIAQSYDQQYLLDLLERRSADLIPVDRYAQMLMRAYATDDGIAFRRIASSYITPVASTLQELSEAVNVLSSDMHERGDVDCAAVIHSQVIVVWRCRVA